MQMNGRWWQVLDVPEDADIKVIKKAYARLIKQYRPESHAVEFACIRAPYEQASLISRSQQKILVAEMQKNIF